MFLRSPARSLLLLLALVSLPHLAVAQASECGPGDLEVVQVSFAGNHAFGSDSLGRAIVTTPSSWMRRVVGLPVGRKRCLDKLELERDVFRLRFFYRQRGYYKTQVEPSQELRGPSRVAVHFQIDEGPPVITDSLTVTGLDTVRNGDRLLRFILPFKGRVYNRLRLQQAIDTVVDRLRNSGYARADEPLRNTFVDTTTDRATVELTFLSGRIYRIGSIDVRIQPNAGDSEPAISPSTVKRLLSVKKGEVYHQRDLLTSQRDLYQLEAYGHVDLGIVPDSAPGAGDSLLTVVAQLSEAKMRSIRLGLGWATLDCFRTQGRYVDRNFLGGARRFELTARLSKIGVGEPFDGFPGLCTTKLRNDQFSEKLNYYLGATFRPPALFGTRNVPSLTLYSERRSEYNAFLRYTPIGGVASITREIARRTPLTLAYQVEYGRTQADEAIFCQVFNVCNLEDIARLQSNNNLRVASMSLARDRSNNAFNPTNGSQMRVELRTGTTSADTAHLRFNKVLGEIALYHPAGGSSVIAARLQLGAVLDGWSLNGASHFVPPQERLYAGGPNSVRGYNQNQLGPVVYVVNSYDTVTDQNTGEMHYRANDSTASVERFSPTGGNTLLVGSLEFRTPSPVFRDLAQLAAFVDVGNVWNRGREDVHLSDLKVTPGIGLRVASPVGPLRLDVGYNGYPRALGAAYYIGPLQPGTPRVLRCVSPDNDFVEGITPSGSECHPTFAPRQRSTLLSRLTFHFSIGQAF